ncbi:MAG: tRNA 2-selenouridine synthase [Fusobacteria bacterium]|nr:MAG: tRNA 2-selenouridine synthase [Fusobacteriota bacterium]KAF0229884.1 MAG: tRNA 2-selenouridine [Fusobacteriota bacterium]
MYLYKELNIDEYINKKDSFCVIDVRSESEFEEDHILGAINIPILNDEERIIVGTVYKEKGVKAAKILARNLTMPNMLVKLNKIYSIIESSKKIPLIYCARGGDRSGVIATFLAMENTYVFRLTGGYKAYRGYVLNYFNKIFDKKIKVFYGLTGTGKTELLLELKKNNLPVIDLEGLANNRGSVFGHIGLGKQPSQKRFDTMLFDALSIIDEKYIIVEGESKKIGRLYIPEQFYDKMTFGDSYLIECSLESRIKRIIDEYGGYLTENKDELIRSIEVLKAHIGNEKIGELIGKFNSGYLNEVVEYLLIYYYDILYEKNRKAKKKYMFNYNTDNVVECSKIIETDLK